MESFKNNVGDFFDEHIEKSNYTSKKMPIIIKKLIDNQINKTIDMRNRLDQRHIQYLQLLFLTYKDGAPMMTIGGILADEELNENNILPEAFDPRVADVVSRAVKELI